MNWEKILHWLPRILGILFALFILLFAFDVFAEDSTFPQKILGFIIHLLPTILALASLFLSWKFKWGGTSFIILSLIYTIFIWDKSSLPALFLLALPGFLIGVLFLLDNLFKKTSQKPYYTQTGW